MSDSEIKSATDFVAAFQGLEALRSSEPAPIAKIRREAIEQYASIGLPTPRQEEWRYTPVEPIAGTRFSLGLSSGGPSGNGATSVSPNAEPAVVAMSIEGAHRLVFVNGRFAGELSELSGLPAGARVESMSGAIGQSSDVAVERFGQIASYLGRPFVALNTALATDGALVVLEDGVTVDEPIHIVYLGDGGDEPVAAHVRTLVVAGGSSKATIVESYGGTGTGHYFTNAVTEIAVGANADIDHYKLQQEHVAAFHIGSLDVALGRDARFSSHSLSTGGHLVRNDVNAELEGEGIECTLNGLYLTSGDQHVDNHMLVRHMEPHCDSHEHYRGILDGQSTAVFNGRIYVHHGAQKTDAKQSNRNLLLTDEATANSNPQLEIFADDVRCTHGSTIGQIDEDALFYLRARGIEEEAARSLLIYAFAAEVLQSVRLDRVKRQIEGILAERLPRGDVVRQAF